MDEERLIGKLIQGDEMAFEILFYRYRGKVSNFIKQSLPVSADIEETVHEVFLRIWINRTRLDEKKPFAPYLFRVARNIVIDELRKNVEHITYLQNGAFTSDFSANNIEQGIEEKELQRWFHLLLEQLPEKRRKIFEMSRFENLSYHEIASQLNISENTVDTQIRRALSFFREEIKKIKSFLFLFF